MHMLHVHVLNSHDVSHGNGERTNTWYVQGQRHWLKAAHYSHPLAFAVYASEDHNVVPFTQVSLFQRDFSLRFRVWSLRFTTGRNNTRKWANEVEYVIWDCARCSNVFTRFCFCAVTWADVAVAMFWGRKFCCYYTNFFLFKHVPSCNTWFAITRVCDILNWRRPQN